MLSLVLLSDTHARHRDIVVPPGDVFLYAGDMTWEGELEIVEDFNNWLGTLPHRHKIVICGNHDWCFEHNPERAQKLITNAIYLQDSGVEIEDLKIWGSPWQPWFYDWAFNLHRGNPIAEKWNLIPADTNLLITHGPPFGFGDRTVHGDQVGCVDLLLRIQDIRPKLHLCGHIHEAAGVIRDGETLFVNASSRTNRGMRAPIVVNWDGQHMTPALSDTPSSVAKMETATNQVENSD